MKYKIGDRVRKVKGYKFEGIVIGSGTKLDGERVLYMVEIEKTESHECGKCGNEDYYSQNGGSMVHIFAEQDIELIDAQNNQQEECECNEYRGTIKLEEGKSICTNCNKTYKLRQSTSLKEEICTLIKEKDPTYQDEREDLADKILSLIQFHLLKEINKRELGDVCIGENYSDVKQGFDYAKQDIIKIVNNIK